MQWKAVDVEEEQLTEDFGTLPRIVMYLLAFSLATRILCGGAIFKFVVVSSEFTTQKRRSCKWKIISY